MSYAEKKLTTLLKEIDQIKALNTDVVIGSIIGNLLINLLIEDSSNDFKNNEIEKLLRVLNNFSYEKRKTSLTQAEKEQYKINLIYLKKYQELYNFTKDGESAEELFGKAYYYAKGYYGKVDYQLAIKYYKESAEKGYYSAFNSIGYCYAHGLGVSQDLSKALEYYEKAHNNGDIIGAFNLAEFYLKGIGTDKKIKEAIDLFLHAAKNGLDEAKLFIAEGKLEDAVNETNFQLLDQLKIYSIDNILNHHKKLAVENNDIASILIIANIYLNPEGRHYDLDEGLDWLKKAVNLGHAESLIRMANIYSDTKNSHYNPKEAFKLLKKADELNYPEALTMLGRCYLNGIGTSQNEIEAFKYFNKGNQEGLLNAKFYTAFCYANGLGVAIDVNLAMKLYEEAATAGHSTAMLHLAWLYSNHPDNPDYEQAKIWNQKAAEHGNYIALEIQANYTNDSNKKEELYSQSIEKGNLDLITRIMCNATQPKFSNDLVSRATTIFLDRFYPVLKSFRELIKNEDIPDKDKLEKSFITLCQKIVTIETRDHLYDPDESDGLTHYTKQDVIYSIINNKNNDKSLRLYMASYLNDPTEGNHFFDSITPLNDEKLFINSQKIRVFSDSLSLNEKELNFILQPYSLSFSKNHDNLNLWRSYGLTNNKANGIGILIPKATLKKFCPSHSEGLAFSQASELQSRVKNKEIIRPFALYKVIYDQESLKRVWEELSPSLNEVVNLIESHITQQKTKDEMLYHVYQSIVRLTFLYKNEAYKAEEEVRAFHIGSLDDALLDERSPSRLYFKTPAILFESKGSRLVLGPQMTQEERVALLWDLRKRINKQKLQDVLHVVSSNVPYR